MVAALIRADTCTGGRIDGRDEAHRRLSRICERAAESARLLHNNWHSLATLVQSDAMSFYYYSGVSSCKHDGLNARHAL